MSARDDHAARVMAGVSEPMCWAALFDHIDELRALLHAQEQAFDADSKEAANRLTELDATVAAVVAALDQCDIDQRRGRSYVSVAALVCVSSVAKAVGR